MAEELPRNGTEAIAQRLLSGQEVTAIVGNRVTPHFPTQEGVRPYVAFWRMSGGEANDLSGSRRLQQGMWRVECYADTDEAAERLMDVVADRLFGNSRKGVPPWQDRTTGVQCCRPADDRDAEGLAGGGFVAGQTASLSFCPQV